MRSLSWIARIVSRTFVHLIGLMYLYTHLYVHRVECIVDTMSVGLSETAKNTLNRIKISGILDGSHSVFESHSHNFNFSGELKGCFSCHYSSIWRNAPIPSEMTMTRRCLNTFRYIHLAIQLDSRARHKHTAHQKSSEWWKKGAEKRRMRE